MPISLVLICGRPTCGMLICAAPTWKVLTSVALGYSALICAVPTSRMPNSQALTFGRQTYVML
jgi:hypothetical protein